MMMKRFLFILAITMATVGSLQAAQINEAVARQVADQFFTAKSSRFRAPAATAPTRLAYKADQGRFYVFDRGERGAFVIVAGDDRMPQVLGYGDNGDFTAQLPPAVRYWMGEMNKQIAYLQAHDNVVAYQPAKRPAAVAPLLTTRWDQSEPYNNYCPTYSDASGNTYRAVTGCVATAMAQIMNFHKWPEVGNGSHSYTCNVNDMQETFLSADFSNSVYRWDLMLDDYDPNSSAESCDAVARLMSDVGISVDMGYGSSSGASEYAALNSLKTYFDYCEKGYMLTRDYYSAEEWDQMLVDELTARRPILYCGFDTDGGHAFVFDGFNTDGYFHVNWGWGGYYDGYFLFSVLNPSNMDFKYMQDAMLGVTPTPQASEVEEDLYVRCYLEPDTKTVQLGGKVVLQIEDMVAQGNKYTGYSWSWGGNRKRYYADVPMSLGVFDQNGVKLQSTLFTYRAYLDDYWESSGQSVSFNLLNSLADGEYKIKLQYSINGDQNYDQAVRNYKGQETYVRMVVSNGVASFYDSFLYSKYTVDSFVLPTGISVNEQFDVDVNMSYEVWGTPSMGPVGNVYLSILKDGTDETVATSEMYEVELLGNEPALYKMQITAPAEWGRYHLTLNDENGNPLMKTPEGWSWEYTEAFAPIFVLPVCDELYEDFESMTANSSTSSKNVQGNFTTWSFTKSGVRDPGEGRCNGTNSVMLKKASTLYTAQPLAHNFFMAQATFFNQSTSASKYTLEYSLDGGSSWVKANTIDGDNAAEVPEKSCVSHMWLLNLSAAQPAQFRIAMIAGNATTYVDDIKLYYIDKVGDVNADGEIGIADINALIDIILSTLKTFPTADVNGDSEVNVADINALIDLILSGK